MDMRSKILMILSVSLLPVTVAMGQQVYCPEHSGYIDTGMTTNDVIKACGQPLSKQQSRTPFMQKVPVQQLIYTILNPGSVYPGLNSAFYNQWSLPSGSPGYNIQFDIINNKVASLRINGSSSNAMSICQGMSVQIGEDFDKVYSSCGTPSAVNETFINQPVPSATKPEVWIYQVDKFQPPISLTFVNGELQSIN